LNAVMIRLATALLTTAIVACAPAAPSTVGVTDRPAKISDQLSLDDANIASLPRVLASARYRAFASFAELVRAAELFVVAEVVSLAPGRRVPDATGTDILPFTNVTVRVMQVAKGDIPVGTTIVLEQTGGIYRPTHAINDQHGQQANLPPDAPAGVRPLPPAVIPDRDMIYELKEDPLLRRGERVVLALRWRSELGLYQLVSLQGRFNVAPNETVRTLLHDDSVVAPFDGMGLSALLSLASQAK
jgi:hypothetical protein